MVASPGVTGLFFSADARLFAYVVEPEGAATVDVIDLDTHTVELIVVGQEAFAGAVSPNNTLFLVRSATESQDGAPPIFNVGVIDTARRYVRSLFPARTAGGVAIAPTAPFAYLTDCNPNGVVSILNHTTGVVVGEIPLDVNPQNIWLTPNGAVAYVTDGGSCPGPGLTDDSVAAVDTTMRREIARIPLGGAPRVVAIAPDGDIVYVTKTVYPARTSVAIISTATNEVIGDIPVSNPGAMAVTPDGTHLYVVNYPNAGAPNVLVIDTAAQRAVGTISFRPSDNPAGLAMHPNGRRAYVSHRDGTGASYIAEVDTATYGIVGEIPVPDAGTGSITIVNTCPGDCEADGRVTAEEILRSVGIALEGRSPQTCPTVDANGDGTVTVDELLKAVQVALDGCGG